MGPGPEERDEEEVGFIGALKGEDQAEDDDQELMRKSQADRVSARLRGGTPALQRRKTRAATRGRAGRALGVDRPTRMRREETLKKRFNVPERARKQDERPLMPGTALR